jgi:lipopolysaccharide transport system ATP-binding protein
MSDIVISVEHLSKRYVIGHQNSGRDGLRHSLDTFLRHPVQWWRERNRERTASREDFWALKDVSFGINQGDAVAIVGRNGAGKSTLLKVLSRITEPTSGRIRLKGRVASLLEVGTGFHQELSGRENIFLNGAILGMSKAEIRSKFDEIVAFSEIEKFLDTPVKRYSSGMYVRLAFAVAAHLEPEILIVDEVLAVGDAAFQKKCLGKMSEVSEGGRTVLFVSHNMGAIQALCRRAVYLQKGTVKMVGDVAPVVQQYLNDTGARSGHKLDKPVDMGNALVLEQFAFTPNPVETGKPVAFRLKFRAKTALTFRSLVILIDSAQNSRVALIDLQRVRFPKNLAAGEAWEVEGTIKSLPFVEGDYSIGLTVNAGDFFENVFELTSVTVTPAPRNEGEVPVPLVYRGVVELEVTATGSR